MKYCTICKEKYDDSVSFCPIDGEVLEDDPSSIVGTVLDGQYQMEAMLGKGGMGAVYQARHILLGDCVAIKVLPPEVRSNAEWLRRFRREGQAARRFRHPNAVTVYDLRTASDGTIYMVMEYVQGHTLDAEMKKRGRFTAAESFQLLEPIMSVLETAHSMGVVHRDLKPENIMVGKPGPDGAPVIKLLDLGIAKMREIAGVETGGNTALTTAGQVLGTPYYMSPEQWGEIPRDGEFEIDGRADLYSLGLVFFEMIAGRRCFAGATLHELRRQHITTSPPPLYQIVPDVPRGFSDAIERATAKDRGDRQATAGQLAAELKAGLSTAVSTETLLERAPVADSMGATITVAGNTNADTNAPTIIGLDASATSAIAGGQVAPQTSPAVKPEVARSQPIASAPSSASSPAPTIASVAMDDSVVTIPQARPTAEPAPAKGKAGLIIGVGAVVVVLILGIGGIFIYRQLKSSPATTNINKGQSVTTTAAPQEIGKYWLELESKAKDQKVTRVAGLVPIASGQSLRMHFAFNESGYVYLIGPGPNSNTPTAFLTSQPAAASGLTTNETKAGEGLSFPSGKDNWLTLDNRPGAENYTVIFCKKPLKEPFLNVPVTFDPLSPEQQSEFKEFVAKYKLNSTTAELDDSKADEPFVRVKSSPGQSDNPIVFEVRIQHN